MKNFKILVINPGSTSTKVAVFDNQQTVFLKNCKHSNEELEAYKDVTSQYEYRKECVLSELINAEINIEDINAVIGRGGVLKPIESGIYNIDESLKEDLAKSTFGYHASNLGGLIADDIAKSIGNIPAFIADPVVVDELQEVARITGLPELPNRSIFHALNQKAVARSFARARGFVYEELNLIVAHIGGGVSVGAHEKGRVIDVNNALDGFGPLSAERSGTLPTGSLVDLCFSGKYTHDEVKKKLIGQGGMVAHLGTNSAYEVELRMEKGDPHAKLVFDAMCYQIGKAIGSCAAVLNGKVNGIIITGGVANSKYLVDYVKNMIDFIAPVAVYPGEDEMTALAHNAFLVLNGDIEAKNYI